MARCWWGQNEMKDKQHWIAWDKFTKSKEEGRMGFKDIQMFNKALLAKQVWRIMTQPNLLVSKVLKEKYFPGGSVLEGKVPRNASWIWQSLMSAREVIKDGCQKKVGNGKGTNIWDDKWINNGRDGRIRTQKPEGSELKKVSQLMAQHRWNRNLIYKVFHKEDAEHILSIPISWSDQEDSMIWKHNNNGQYTVANGYKILQQEEMDKKEKRSREEGCSYQQTNKELWEALWKMPIKHKMKIFVWKCINKGYQSRLKFSTEQEKEILYTAGVERVWRPLSMYYCNARKQRKSGNLHWYNGMDYKTNLDASNSGRT